MTTDSYWHVLVSSDERVEMGVAWFVPFLGVFIFALVVLFGALFMQAPPARLSLAVFPGIVAGLALLGLGARRVVTFDRPSRAIRIRTGVMFLGWATEHAFDEVACVRLSRGEEGCDLDLQWRRGGALRMLLPDEVRLRQVGTALASLLSSDLVDATSGREQRTRAGEVGVPLVERATVRAQSFPIPVGLERHYQGASAVYRLPVRMAKAHRVGLLLGVIFFFSPLLMCWPFFSEVTVKGLTRETVPILIFLALAFVPGAVFTLFCTGLLGKQPTAEELKISDESLVLRRQVGGIWTGESVPLDEVLDIQPSEGGGVSVVSRDGRLCVGATLDAAEVAWLMTEIRREVQARGQSAQAGWAGQHL